MKLINILLGWEGWWWWHVEIMCAVTLLEGNAAAVWLYHIV
jgi:hypothetical protein